MHQPHLIRTVRRSFAAIAILTACAVCSPLSALAGAPPSSTTPASEATSAPQTWSLKPATAVGPDDRAHLVYEVVPGQSITDYVAVTNFSDEPLELSVYASDAFTPDDGGFDLLPSTEQSVDVGKWIHLDESALHLEARETKLIALQLNVPRNATPGDHAGGVVAALGSTTTDAAGNRVVVEHRVGARVYLTVDGPLAPGLELVDVTMSHEGSPNPIGAGEVEVHYTVHNVGNVRLAARQVLTVTGPRGIVLGRTTLDDVAELLPGASIDQVARVDGVEPTLRLQATLRLEPYSADQRVTVQPVEHTESLWAVPWTQGAVVLILVAGLVWRRRSRRRATAPAIDESAEQHSVSPLVG